MIGTEDSAADARFEPNNSNASPSGELHLLDLLIAVAKRKTAIVICAVAAGILTALLSLLLPNIYTATAKVLPPQQSQSTAAALLGQLGGFGGIAGASLGIKNPVELYVGMLRSRTVADNLIERFQLKALYAADTMSTARAALQGNSNIMAGRDGFITVEFSDKDPNQAAAVANAYVEELDKLTQSLAVTEAAQRRLFFERQLQRAKDDLVKAEIAARSALGKGGVAMVDEQGRSMIESIARMRAQITAKEVQISAMSGFANEQNPNLLLVRQELAALRQQLSKLEGTAPHHGMSTTKESGSGLRNLALLRDVRYAEVLFELLAKQYEIAKIEEAKESAIVQVIDRAIVPDRKSKPRRLTIVLAVTLAVGLLGILWALLREAQERASSDPLQSARLAALRRHLRFR